MDKLSVKVLKFIASKPNAALWKEVINAFGDTADKSLAFLEAEGYVKSGRRVIGVGSDMKPVFGSDGHFVITSKGLAFLEEKPGRDFDRWLTRIIAIWGAITGTAALVIEVVLHFL